MLADFCQAVEGTSESNMQRVLATIRTKRPLIVEELCPEQYEPLHGN